jgi:protein-tyrosine-phosphatase
MRSVLREIATVSKTRPVRIVFVCTANCTRSPFAEILFEKLLIDTCGTLRQVREKHLIIESAGIYSSGFTISLESRDFLIREEGVSESRCDSHIGRGIANIEEPDLVLTMDNNHVSEVLRAFPDWSDKVYQLDRFVRFDKGSEGSDIDDPTGLEKEDYENMKSIIKEDLHLLLDEFKDVGLV